jgi:hypothetical protein
MAFMETFGEGVITQGVHFVIGIHPIGGRPYGQMVALSTLISGLAPGFGFIMAYLHSRTK